MGARLDAYLHCLKAHFRMHPGFLHFGPVHGVLLNAFGLFVLTLSLADAFRLAHSGPLRLCPWRPSSECIPALLSGPFFGATASPYSVFCLYTRRSFDSTPFTVQHLQFLVSTCVRLISRRARFLRTLVHPRTFLLPGARRPTLIMYRTSSLFVSACIFNCTNLPLPSRTRTEHAFCCLELRAPIPWRRSDF